LSVLQFTLSYVPFSFGIEFLHGTGRVPFYFSHFKIIYENITRKVPAGTDVSVGDFVLCPVVKIKRV